MDPSLKSVLQEAERTMETIRSKLPPGFEQYIQDYATAVQPYADIAKKHAEMLAATTAGIDWASLRPAAGADSLTSAINAMPIPGPRHQEVHVHVHVHLVPPPEPDAAE